MKYKNIITKIKFYLISVIIFISIIFSNSLWADYVNITKYGDQVMEFADALKNITADYHECADNIKGKKTIQCISTYEFINDFAIGNYHPGIDLTKKRLKSLLQSLYKFDEHIEFIYEVFGSIKTHNPKIAPMYEAIKFFYDKKINDYRSIANLCCNIKQILWLCSSAPEEENVSLIDFGKDNYHYIQDLNIMIDSIHVIHENLNCDEVKINTFFSYIAAYTDIKALSRNNTDYISEIAYYYLTSKFHNYSFAIALYNLFQSNATLIKKHHEIAKSTIKNICNDKDLEDIFSLRIRNVLDQLGIFHKKLINLIKELESNKQDNFRLKVYC